MTAPEFARPVRIDTLGEAPRTLAIAADEGERAALATRFGLVAIARLEADAALARDGDVVTAEGRVRAELTQSCAATGVPLEAAIDAPFALRFVPAGDMPPDDEIELDDTDLDTVPYDGAAVDLGEAVAETMALALDPFPRAPDADIALKQAGVLEEGDVGPFAALRALKERLAK